MLNRLATMATTAIAHRRVLSIFMTISLRNCQPPPSDSRWQRLFKAVLNDKQARLFAELQACGRGEKSCLNPFRAVVEHWHVRYKATSPICDRRRSTSNVALNGGRFALPVDGPHYQEGVET